MSKARKFGRKSTYIPNCRADERRPKLMDRRRGFTYEHETMLQEKAEKLLQGLQARMKEDPACKAYSSDKEREYMEEIRRLGLI